MEGSSKSATIPEHLYKPLWMKSLSSRRHIFNMLLYFCKYKFDRTQTVLSYAGINAWNHELSDQEMTPVL